MMSDVEFDKHLKHEFLSEVEEIVQKLEDALLRLEQSKNQAKLMNEIFRYAHTLKGSGLAAGFTAFGQFAHKLENLLEAMRVGKAPMSHAAVSLILEAVDGLRSYGALLSLDPDARKDFRNLEEQMQQFMAAPAAPSAGQAPQPKLEPGFKPRVFICDDQIEICEAIRDSLPHEWQVEMFASAEKFIQSFEIQAPHLIITDLVLPGMNGRQLIEQVRQSKANPIVIFISGYAERADIADFLRLGVFAFFEKPFQVDDLARTAKRALKDWVQHHTLEEISVLAFRAFMSFNSFADSMPSKGNDPEYAERMKIFEENIMKIGALCSRASQFGKM